MYIAQSSLFQINLLTISIHSGSLSKVPYFNIANNFYMNTAANYQRKTNEAAHDLVQEVLLLRYYTIFFGYFQK